MKSIKTKELLRKDLVPKEPGTDLISKKSGPKDAPADFVASIIFAQALCKAMQTSPPPRPLKGISRLKFWLMTKRNQFYSWILGL